MSCDCKPKLPDRLEITRCARGYLVSPASEYDRLGRPLYAFDHIQDVATFLVEQLGNEKSA